MGEEASSARGANPPPSPPTELGLPRRPASATQAAPTAGKPELFSRAAGTRPKPCARRAGKSYYLAVRYFVSLKNAVAEEPSAAFIMIL